MKTCRPPAITQPSSKQERASQTKRRVTRLRARRRQGLCAAHQQSPTTLIKTGAETSQTQRHQTESTRPPGPKARTSSPASYFSLLRTAATGSTSWRETQKMTSSRSVADGWRETDVRPLSRSFCVRPRAANAIHILQKARSTHNSCGVHESSGLKNVPLHEAIASGTST